MKGRAEMGGRKALKIVAAAVIAAVAASLSGCRYGKIAAGRPSLKVERIQFGERNPAAFRVLVEKPVLSGARVQQQKAVDGWIAKAVSFGFGNGNCATVESVLDAMAEKVSGDVAEAKRNAAGEPLLTKAISYWYFDLDAQIAYADANYLAYQARLDEFKGWLHPFRNYSWRVWSFERERELSPDDVFKKESMPEVVALVKENMAYSHDCTNFVHYAETRFIEDFRALPANFTLDKRGIQFLFNAYEIACYAEGDIRGFVSWEQLRPYVRPDFTLP